MNATKAKNLSPTALGALRALRRAARNAMLLARQTQTGFIVSRNGKIIDLNARRNRPGVRRKPYTPEEKAAFAQKLAQR
jgi:hypothetical protein